MDVIKKFRIKDFLHIILGSMLVAIGVQMFYVPHNLVTGGVVGIGIILLEMASIPLWLTNIAANSLLLLVGFKFLAKDVVFKTAFTIGAVTVSMSLAQYLPNIEPDLMLSVIFGGGSVGIGSAMIMRRGATSGGTFLLAAIIRKFLKHMKLTHILFAIDFVIILGGLLLFGPTATMYAIVAILIFTKVTDIVISGYQSAKAMFILTKKSEEVSKVMFQTIIRGVTAIPARGLYTGDSKDMLLCILSQRELVLAKEVVKEVDPEAFIIITSASEVIGLGFRHLD